MTRHKQCVWSLRYEDKTYWSVADPENFQRGTATQICAFSAPKGSVKTFNEAEGVETPHSLLKIHHCILYSMKNSILLLVTGVLLTLQSMLA